MKRIYVIIEGLELGMQFLLYHAVACFVAGLYMGDGQNQNYYMGLLLLPLVIFAWAREYVNKLFLFILIHMVVFAGLLFMGRHGAEFVAFFVCGMIMLINSFLYRLSEKHQYDRTLYTQKPHIALCLSFAGISCLAWWTERPQIEALCYWEFMFFLLFYIIHENLYNTEKFLKLNSETANLPAMQMKGVSRIFLSFFTLLAMAVMLLFPRLHLEAAVKGIGRLLLYLLRAFFSLFRRDEIIEEPIIENIPMGEGKFWMEPKEASWLAVFLQELLLLLVQIGIAVGIAAGVFFGLYQLYKYFYGNRRTQTDESELIAGEVFTERIFLRRKARREKQGNTINQKIRNVYRRYMKRAILANEIPPAHLTPTELERYLQKQEQTIALEQEKQRIALYEKARYGNRECSREELDAMKQAVRENLKKLRPGRADK